MRFRSFKRGTVSLCRSKGCKTTSCQSWRSEKNPAARPTSHHTSAARVWFPDDKIILQLWQLVTLQPVDLQTPTVPLWKDLNLFCWLNYCPRDKKHCKDRFRPVKVTPFQKRLCTRGIYHFFRYCTFNYQYQLLWLGFSKVNKSLWTRQDSNLQSSAP